MGYDFDGFRVDVAKRELSRHGDPLEIQKRVFDLLIYLVENRARTVSKDEIQDAVWPGTVVTETALTRAVMKARKVLDDDASEQRYIKTVHGQGYRFIGELTQPVDIPDEPDKELERANRRQSLLRVATTYGAGAWLINQAASMIWEAFEWDRWPQQLLLGLSVLGFPIALLLTWFYKATPQGVALRSELTRSQQGIVPSSRWQIWTMGILVLALGLSLTWNLRPSGPVDTAASRLAVLPIVNETGDEALAWISLGMMGLLNDQLSAAKLSVVAPAAVLKVVPEAVNRVGVEHLERLQVSENAGRVIQLRMMRRGDEYAVTGLYFDQGEVTDLPQYLAPKPGEAIRRMGTHMLQMLSVPRSLQQVDQLAMTGDVFADQAYARGMYEQLSGNLHRAEELFTVAVSATPEHFGVNYELAETLRRLGEYDAAKARQLPLLDRARREQDAVAIANVSNSLGIINDLQGDLDQAHLHYEEGLQWARQASLFLREAKLLTNLAILERARADPVKGREYLVQAVAAFEQAGIEVLPGHLYITMGNTAADSGDLQDTKRRYEQALRNFRRLQDAQGEGSALSNLSWVSDRLGDIDAAFAYLDESLAVRQRIGDDVGLLRSKSRKADLLYSVGRYSEVLELADELLQTPYIQQDKQLFATALSYQAAVARRRGQSAVALNRYREALATDQAAGWVFGQVRAQLGIVQVLLDMNDLEQAQAQLQVLQETLPTTGLDDFKLQTTQAAARLSQLRGNDAQAEQMLLDAFQLAHTQDNGRRAGAIAVELATRSMQADDSVQSRRWITEALLADKGNGEALLLDAQLSMRNADYDAAEQQARAAKKMLGEWRQDDVNSILLAAATSS